MFRIEESTMVRYQDRMAGRMIVSNGSDSQVIFEGSDDLMDTIASVEEALQSFKYLPKEITELKSATYSVKLIGKNAKALLVEMLEFTLDTMKSLPIQ